MKSIILSSAVGTGILLAAFFCAKKQELIPCRLQNALEVIVAGIDELIRGILGPNARPHTPFIGTLFIYILSMNLLGLVPFLKSPCASWSTTLGLAICVFIYVHYTGIKQMGLLGYLDHLAGRPRGILALSLIMPLFMFCLHIIAEFIRPISLSLRLRSNIWGDELLLSLLAGFGIKGLPLLFFNMLMAVLTAMVQAVVFCLLTTIYLALAVGEESEAVKES